MTHFCSRCGAKTPDESNFCPSCGTELEMSAQAQEEQGVEQAGAPLEPRVNTWTLVRCWLLGWVLGWGVLYGDGQPPVGSSLFFGRTMSLLGTAALIWLVCRALRRGTLNLVRDLSAARRGGSPL
jgi:hypothetical protein